MKILYCCPFAHYSGHHPHAATVEPKMLAESGTDVAVITFCGITNNPQTSIPHYTVIPTNWMMLRWLRKNVILRWFLMLSETALTIHKAMRLYRRLKYDVIYLRDGEPYLFTSFLLNFPLRNFRWLISLTSSNLFTPSPRMFKFYKNPYIYLYTLALQVVNGRVWKPLYQWGLHRNKHTFVTQNEEASRGYNVYQSGIFAGKVTCIPLGTTNSAVPVSKSDARARLGLPQDMLILLSFGAPHSGKDIGTVIKAVTHVPEVFLVHAGTQAFSLGSNPKGLTKEYNLNCRTKIFNYYIREEEKPPFFYAADVLILSYTKVFKSTSSMLWEATRYHLPVISSSANLLGSTVAKYNLGLLFEAENAKSLTEAIQYFRTLKLEELKLMEQGRQRFFEDYSSKKWIDNTLNACRQLVEAK